MNASNKSTCGRLKNGRKLGKSKSVCLHFCQLKTRRKLHNDPNLKMNGCPIKDVRERGISVSLLASCLYTAHHSTKDF